jgi:hypothetical protein
LEQTLAARLETPVGSAANFLSIFDANQPRFFRKCEQSAFGSNLRQWRPARHSSGQTRAGMTPTVGSSTSAECVSATDRSPFRTNAPAKPQRNEVETGARVATRFLP